MNKQTTLLQLFMRELGQCTLQNIDSLDLSLLECKKFIDWVKSKRNLVSNDVVGTHWIKSCTGGYITELIFNDDGTLNEYRLFDRFPTTGKWSLDDGILNVEIIKGDNTYRFSVVGNLEINIHSAVEHKNGKLHSFLKFAQVK